MDISTADLCDNHGDELLVARPVFRSFGGFHAFHGPVRTVQVLDDNTLVRQALEQPAEGSVLVVDGGGSMNCALLGDRLAAMAVEHGWRGVVVNGCIRDSAELAALPLGVLALAAHPRKSRKQGRGRADVIVAIAGISIAPGNYLYADEDGLIVATRDLLERA